MLQSFYREHFALFFAEHSRHKTLFCIAYVIHEALKGVNPETAGQFYLVIELLHSMVG